MNRTARFFAALVISAACLPAQDGKGSKVDIDVAVGHQGFHKRPDPLNTKLTDAGLFGVRVTENLWNHWSLEQSFTNSIGADLYLNRTPGTTVNRQDFNQRTRTFMFNPVYHLTEAGSRVRPYVTMGLGAVSYSPTSAAKEVGLALRPYPAANLDTSTRFGVNYGGGVKIRLSNLFSFRFDMRGVTSGAPNFGLPATGPAGSFYIPTGGRAHMIQTTAGVLMSFGSRGAAPAAPSTSGGGRVFRLDPIAANPPSPIRTGTPSQMTTHLTDSKNSKNVVWDWTVNGAKQPSATGDSFRFDPVAPGTYQIQVTATDGKYSAAEKYTMVVQDPEKRTFTLDPIQANPPSPIWAGESTNLSARLNDSANSSSTVCEWTVNGNKAATGTTFRFTPPGPGTYNITVTCRDGAFSASQSYTLVVKEVPPLTITAAADRNEVKAGETVRLTAQANQTEYSGPLTYSWKASDGTVSGGGSTGAGTLNTSTVQFDPAAQFRQQNKTVTLTASVTDRRGRSATAAPITVRVTRDPQVVRLDDVIFGKGSARVNNCGKRILIDELAAIVNNNPDVEVLLIGHRDASEKGLVDRERTLNAAAVISAGKGICGTCALERIKVDWVGADQSSESRAGFCGASSRNKSEERKADEIAADDAAARNRRVEIWIVPKGMAMPSAAKAPKAAPVQAIRSRGCPK
jgi:outer membrane protein OmpA-like peptidoglycan-associated protein/opacity protein-like surface antigen